MNIHVKSINKESFKQTLTDIICGRLLSYDHNLLIDNMLTYIGDVDAYLRDDLIYTQFCRMMANQEFSTSQFSNLFDVVASSNFLFCDIELAHTDSVFRRSFSALVLAEMIHTHKKFDLLDSKKIDQAVITAVDYMRLEKDERGFVLEKGWAHATAHGADILRNLAEISSLSRHQDEEILKAVVHKLQQLSQRCEANEEKRLALVFLKMIEKNTDKKMIEAYLMSLTKIDANISDIKTSNIQTFLKALKELLEHNYPNHFIIDKLNSRL